MTRSYIACSWGPRPVSPTKAGDQVREFLTIIQRDFPETFGIWSDSSIRRKQFRNRLLTPEDIGTIVSLGVNRDEIHRKPIPELGVSAICANSQIDMSFLLGAYAPFVDKSRIGKGKR